MAAATAWHIRGSYFESCNCDAICPCRRIDGVSGGRSTHGICLGVLTWLIEEGEAGGTDLAGLPVALATRYDDDEPGSPWTWILYLDERASEEQQEALEAIFTGRLGGDALEHFQPRALLASAPRRRGNVQNDFRALQGERTRRFREQPVVADLDAEADAAPPRAAEQVAARPVDREYPRCFQAARRRRADREL